SSERTWGTSWRPTTSPAGSRPSAVSRHTNTSAKSGHASQTDSSLTRDPPNAGTEHLAAKSGKRISGGGCRALALLLNFQPPDFRPAGAGFAPVTPLPQPVRNTADEHTRHKCEEDHQEQGEFKGYGRILHGEGIERQNHRPTV